jgi:predicted RNase H-like nuclease (RuvC/YqgF family)
MENLEEANQRLTRQLIELDKRNKLLENELQLLQTRISNNHSMVTEYVKEIEALKSKLANCQRLAKRSQTISNLDDF